MIYHLLRACLMVLMCIVAGLCCLAISGCFANTPSRLRGEGFSDKTSLSNEDVARKGKTGKSFGYNTKAQQIEGNLGFK
jgi:hypothetical protein